MTSIKEKRVVGIFNFLFSEKNGATTVANNHVMALYETFGKQNVSIIALTGGDTANNNDYIIRANKANIVIKLLNLFSGHTGRINTKIENDIINYINAENPELVFIDDSVFGTLVKKIAIRCECKSIACYYHDVKRYLIRQWINKYPYKAPVYWSLAYNEYLTQKYATYNIVLNEREAKLYLKYYHKQPEKMLPVIVNDPYANQKPIEQKNSDRLEILFVGAYYFPNINGINWFINKVIPLINRKIHFTIVGNGMDKLNQFNETNNISVYGRQEDLTYFYENADCVIGPIFEGGGMKVKTAEAFSYGKKFIGTDESLTGYLEKAKKLIDNKKIILCNDEEQFAAAIDMLTANNKFDSDIYQYYRKNYSLEAAKKMLMSL
jgi:hypothetical protein